MQSWFRIRSKGIALRGSFAFGALCAIPASRGLPVFVPNTQVLASGHMFTSTLEHGTIVVQNTCPQNGHNVGSLFG